MSYHEGENGDYSYQIEQDRDDCEVYLYRCGELVDRVYFHGPDAFVMCLGVARHWLRPVDAPDLAPLSAAPGYQSHPDG
jgi:hypothetical protein